jgi:hypothetical protein
LKRDGIGIEHDAEIGIAHLACADRLVDHLSLSLLSGFGTPNTSRKYRHWAQGVSIQCSTLPKKQQQPAPLLGLTTTFRFDSGLPLAGAPGPTSWTMAWHVGGCPHRTAWSLPILMPCRRTMEVWGEGGDEWRIR